MTVFILRRGPDGWTTIPESPGKQHPEIVKSPPGTQLPCWTSAWFLAQIYMYFGQKTVKAEPDVLITSVRPSTYLPVVFASHIRV